MYKYEFNADECWFKSVCKDFKKPGECYRGCLRYMVMHYLAYASDVPKKMQYPEHLIVDVPKDDKVAYLELNRLKSNICDFVSYGGSLLIQSKNTGNGKTTWAIKLLMKFLEKQIPVCKLEPQGRFVNLTNVYTKMRINIQNNSGYTEKLMNDMYSLPLVVFDDMGVADLSKYEYTTLYDIINTRCNNGLASIYTTNLMGTELLDVLGNRLYSRVNNGEVVTFTSKDRRVNAHERNGRITGTK